MAACVLGGLAAAACSAPDPGSLEPKTPTGDERDTELKHEPCDLASASANRVDVNSDGKPDITHVMAGGREICRVVDLNLDGAIDAFIYYDPQGLERRRESDFDRDGRPDEITVLQGGVVVRKERETNFDNKIDTWDYYAGGRLVQRERDSDGDAVIDQWWQFNNPTDPRCAIVASDRNTDGKPDPDSVLDLCGEAYGAPKPASAEPAAAPPLGVPGAAAGGQQGQTWGRAVPPGAAPPGAYPQQPYPQQQYPQQPYPQQPYQQQYPRQYPQPYPQPSAAPPPVGPPPPSK